ncbi:hypothetical protein QYF36_007282 [Acer negundo]|nr:hypothetical protein QYF36_007282 [Acer negundo]
MIRYLNGVTGARDELQLAVDPSRIGLRRRRRNHVEPLREEIRENRTTPTSSAHQHLESKAAWGGGWWVCSI